MGTITEMEKEALDAFKLCCEKEGIIPALEPSHALAYVEKLLQTTARSHHGHEHVWQVIRIYLQLKV